MKVFLYVSGCVLLLLAGTAFYMLSQMSTGSRIVLFIVGLFLAGAGIYCFMVPHMSKYRALF